MLINYFIRKSCESNDWSWLIFQKPLNTSHQAYTILPRKHVSLWSREKAKWSSPRFERSEKASITAAHDRPELGPDDGELHEAVIGRQTHAFPDSRRLLSPGLLEEPADAGSGGAWHSSMGRDPPEAHPVNVHLLSCGGGGVHVHPLGHHVCPRASHRLFCFAASAQRLTYSLSWQTRLRRDHARPWQTKPENWPTLMRSLEKLVL